ncbi:hypothetical protein G3T14_10870 [Methylobacterium sp. BTF04]|uniref:hypothetical protein n=1 Tax=Methylobacterium sp. BTF04 TaxID=2708300 RepID=UPI0013D84C68|nr:hypothetical protein [Methylobacterium sp. BTF04]NEU12639.1 hypothetical protein [Methylobacterium sp. BTF04]
MRHVLLPRPAPRRSPMRRALALHRPRSPSRSRIERDRETIRLSDVILAMLGLTLLGALGLMAGAGLLGRVLAP